MWYSSKSNIQISKSFKTASSSVYQLIKDNWFREGDKLIDNHWTHNKIEDEWGVKGKRITLIRNPWDYIVSAYHWALRNGEAPNEYSFEDFLYKPSGFDWKKQLEYWDCESDDVIQLETLDADIERIRTKYNLAKITIPLTHQKKTLHRGNYQSYYNKESRDYIRLVFGQQLYYWQTKFGINYKFH